ncbi:MAG: peptidylprolyl isomerase [Pseudohongiellaceae bacterium]
MASPIPVGPGTRVKLLFTLRLATGEEVDSTGNRPAEFTVGDGNLLPGFEQALFGLKSGMRQVLRIDAASGFGDHKPENVQRMPRASFSADLALHEGLVVSFADSQKAEVPGVISRLDGNMVEVDFNHPLAGYDIDFEVEILEVEQVSSEIVRAGN